jgi:hypothetical protein
MPRDKHLLNPRSVRATEHVVNLQGARVLRNS